MPTQTASGELTHFNWKVDVDASGRLGLGSNLDAVTSKITCALQHLVVEPLGKHLKPYPEPGELGHTDILRDNLISRVNGAEVHVMITLTLKSTVSEEIRDVAEEMIGVVLARANVVLAETVLTASDDDVHRKAEKDVADMFEEFFGGSAASLFELMRPRGGGDMPNRMPNGFGALR